MVRGTFSNRDQEATISVVETRGSLWPLTLRQWVADEMGNLYQVDFAATCPKLPMGPFPTLIAFPGVAALALRQRPATVAVPQ